MNGDDRLRRRILSGRSDANIRFEELRTFLLRLGFRERIKGSHHIFTKAGFAGRLNIQPQGNRAKPYQVAQVRDAILESGLLGGE